MSDPTPADIERFIAEALVCERLEVEGDGRHFFATIVSPAFEGKSRIARHQQVYQALGDRMREQIHALSMKTLTPVEFASSLSPSPSSSSPSSSVASSVPSSVSSSPTVDSSAPATPHHH